MLQPACPSCGKPYDQGDTFCGECGGPLPPRPQAQPPQARYHPDAGAVARGQPEDVHYAPAAPTSTAPPATARPAAPAGRAVTGDRRGLNPLLIGGGVGALLLLLLAIFLVPGMLTPRRNTASTLPPTAGIVHAAVDACGRRVSAAIYDKWQQLGGEAGFLGCPVSDEAPAGPSPKGTTGRSVTFGKDDGGTIVLHQSGSLAGKAYEVHGCMYKIYSGDSAATSALGFPVSDEYDVPGGRRSDFEGGYIVWDAQTARCQATLTP